MKRLNGILMLLALIAMSLFALGGCGDDDGVTPDEQPTVTAEDAAGQAAFVAMSMVDVLDELVSKAIPSEQFVNKDCVYGSYWKDSGPDHVYTDGTHFLTVDFDCDGVQDEVDNGTVTFDITSIADVANGTGVLVIGSLTITFNVENVEMDGGYPDAGQMIVSSSGHTATIVFTGGHNAVVTVGTRSWTVDLDNGDIVEI